LRIFDQNPTVLRPGSPGHDVQLPIEPTHAATGLERNEATFRSNDGADDTESPDRFELSCLGVTAQQPIPCSDNEPAGARVRGRRPEPLRVKNG
jgi:hypothetical protein